MEWSCGRHAGQRVRGRFMKITLRYGGKSYGTEFHVVKYKVKVNRVGKAGDAVLDVNFAYSASGRGVGMNQGFVRGFTLAVPTKAARALSEALALASAAIQQLDLEFKVDESDKNL